MILAEGGFMNARWKPWFVLSLACLLGGSLVGPSPVEAQNRLPKKKPVRRPAPKPEPLKKTVLPSVTEVDKGRLGSVLAAARRIDALVGVDLDKHNIKPNPETTDEQFVRRLYLDITGTIPTLPQTKSFLRQSDSRKRQRLIDNLLNSYGYVSHNYNYWGGILRLQNRPDNNIIAEPYLDYVKESLRANKPYDKWVSEMLTAEGRIWDDPAAGYVLRDDGMPLNHLSNTVQVFLGTQIGCAQCHDHPFDRWKQKEFYELAALMYPTMTRRFRNDPYFKGKYPVPRINEEVKKSGMDRKTTNLVNKLVRVNLRAVYDLPRRKLKYPHDYANDDAKPNQVVSPGVLWGKAAQSGKKPREVFASWITSRENPRFALTAANRLWKKNLGRGLIEPVDDIRDDTQASNPALMKYLAQLMIDLNFDLKEFQRVIYNTETYQRQASVEAPNPNVAYRFPGPVLRRMTAEQAWDSFLTMAVVDPEQYRAPSSKKLSELVNLDLNTATGKMIAEQAAKYQEFDRGKEKREREKKYRYKGVLLARASELPVPAPAGHFLQQFGQGDRELIEGNNTDGSVVQVLTMFNGPITHMLLEGGSTMFKNVVAEKSTNDRIDVIFLTILSRKPNTYERGLAAKEIKSEGNAGYGDVIWALVNTREFLFIQ